VINAFTSKEHTCYYAKVLDENLPLAIDLLTDIFLHSSFDAQEIERERSVILQEISQAEDTPDDYVHDLFNLDFFKNHPIGRPICGSEVTVNNFQREDILGFFKSRYRPRRVIVSTAGNFRHQALVEEMAARLGSVLDGDRQDGALSANGEPTPEMGSGVFPHAKSLEQVHLCLGVAGISQAHPKRYVAYVLNTLLGGGMSSRLFQEIREKRGKAYSVYSFSSSYKDVGYLGVYAGTSLESTDSWMSHIARNEIYFGKTVSTEEICQKIRAVSRDDMIELADMLFAKGAMTLTLLGGFDDNFQIKNLNH